MKFAQAGNLLFGRHWLEINENSLWKEKKSIGKNGADLLKNLFSNTFVQSDLCIAILFNKLWNSSG